MTRVSAILAAVLIAAAPVGAAQAQDRGRGDLFGSVGGSSLGSLLGQGGGQRGPGNRQDNDRGPRLMSEAQAQSIAQSRAGGARFVGSLGLRGGSYVFRFERDGRIIDIAVDARGG